MTSDRTYTAAATEIADITYAATKRVTLTTGFSASSYALDESTTVLDATNATKALRTGAGKATTGVNITGVANFKNSIVGSAYNDTLTGGTVNDNLRGGEGVDLFIQSAETDTIEDYTEGETIQLLSKPIREGSRFSSSYQYVTAEGTVIVNNGLDKTITTVVGGSNDVASTDDELWGVSGKQDTFLFDGGKDTIHNYEADDVIKLGDDYSLSELVNGAPSVSENNLVFTFDKANSLTISDVAGSGTAVTFDDGTSYSGDGKKLTNR